ncbi:unnamed protein product [Adineta steineri]|uniref:Uncharacterized protein n=1 Tax=Adineta steineri TaxID=433720 RepID=A0A819TLP7_9BILA|nr:unnamed protein product [Adineta steineri]CAF4080376.1 unnamed protein product [Adineta steineri]
MFLYRSYISDIHRQLQHHQLMCPIQVYRSQLMSTSELNYLQQQKGQLVSVNSFLSTSTDREVADIYTGDTTQYKNLERVLFEIDADPKVVTTKPFADISRLSHFREESEVLFMLGSIFRIESINCTNQLWTIHMSLCRDDEHDLKEVLEYMKKQNGIEQTNLCTWSKILLKMGKFDLAKKYYIRCVNELLDKDPLLLMAYEGLADIAYQQNDYDETIKWQQKLNDFKDRMTPENTYFCNSKQQINGKMEYLPEQIVKLEKLKTLKISHVNLTYLPNIIGNLLSLTDLSIINTTLRSLPKTISNLKSLKRLRLQNNPYLHSIKEIDGLPALHTLDVRHCSIQDLPRNLPQLVNLYMPYNSLTRLNSDITTLSNKANIEQNFEFNNNRITSITPEIRHVHTLSRLHLDHNLLHNLPRDMFDMKKLTDLFLRNNSVLPNEKQYLNNEFKKKNPKLKFSDNLFYLIN